MKTKIVLTKDEEEEIKKVYDWRKADIEKRWEVYSIDDFYHLLLELGAKSVDSTFIEERKKALDEAEEKRIAEKEREARMGVEDGDYEMNKANPASLRQLECIDRLHEGGNISDEVYGRCELMTVGDADAVIKEGREVERATERRPRVREKGAEATSASKALEREKRSGR